MLAKIVDAAVEKALDRRTVRPDRRLMPDGYHPLPAIMGALYSWVFVPFCGTEILVEVRFPRSTQVPAADKLWATAGEGKTEKKLSFRQIAEILNMQEECCRAVLNRPTFEELEKEIHGKDRVLAGQRQQLAELREMLQTASGGAKQEAQREIDMLELFCGYVLPDDTMLALTNIALGIGVSDIQKVSKEKLVAAHAKARLYGGRPSDFVPGIFTDGDRENIDGYAAWLGNLEETKKQRGRR